MIARSPPEPATSWRLVSLRVGPPSRVTITQKRCHSR